jgi:hypothetical protein
MGLGHSCMRTTSPWRNLPWPFLFFLGRRVLFGSLHTSEGNTSFIVPGDADEVLQPIQKVLTLENRFAVPLLLHSAHIEDPRFDISGFVPGTVVDPGSYVPQLVVSFSPESRDTLLTTTIDFVTNVSVLHVPLQVRNHPKVPSSPSFTSLSSPPSSPTSSLPPPPSPLPSPIYLFSSAPLPVSSLPSPIPPLLSHLSSPISYPPRC